jgi:WD40 repeat protein
MLYKNILLKYLNRDVLTIITKYIEFSYLLTQQLVIQENLNLRHSIYCILLHNNLIITCNSDSNIYIYELTNNNYILIKTLKGHIYGINKMIIHDNLLVSVSNDGFMRFWDLLDYTCAGMLDFESNSNIVNLTSNTHIIACCVDNKIFIISKNEENTVSVKNRFIYEDDIYQIEIIDDFIIFDQGSVLCFITLDGKYKNNIKLDNYECISCMCVYNDILVIGDTCINILEKNQETNQEKNKVNTYITSQVLLKDNTDRIYAVKMYKDILICGLSSGLIHVFHKSNTKSNTKSNKLSNKFILKNSLKCDDKIYLSKDKETLLQNSVFSLAYNDITNEILSGYSLNSNINIFT